MLFLAISSVLLGLILLSFGWNVLIDGAVAIARRFSLSHAIIGLTIVAIGTSMPELVVSVLASISGNTEIAIWNVLWSNVANVFLILGLTACISTITLSRTTRFFDLPFVILVTLLLWLVASDIFFDWAEKNIIWRIDWIVLLCIAIGYILYAIKHNNFVPEDHQEVEVIRSSWKAILWIVLWIWILFFGWKILVQGAVDIAKIFWLSESIIGLTIVAIGTSMPEMVTSIIAARKGNSEIAVWNIIGSNIMNILVILGISAIIAPLPFLNSSYFDLFIAFFGPVALILLAFVWTRNQIGKKEGVLLLLVYVLYILYHIGKEMWMHG